MRRFANGNWYDGEWKKGTFDGQGSLVSQTGGTFNTGVPGMPLAEVEDMVLIGY